MSGMAGARKRAILHFLSIERRVHAVHGRTSTGNRERKGGIEELGERGERNEGREGEMRGWRKGRGEGGREGERGEGRRREAGNKRDPIARESKFYCNTGTNIFLFILFLTSVLSSLLFLL